MEAFENALQLVLDDIENSMEQREPLQPFFESIRDFVVKTIRSETDMGNFVEDYNTIDSLWNQIHIIPDNQFNVMLKMRLPFAEDYVKKVDDVERPGLSRLRCNIAALNRRFEGPDQRIHRELIHSFIEDTTKCISRSKLQKYAKIAFVAFMQHTKGKCKLLGQKFSLSYDQVGALHTIHATTIDGNITLNINFVVALVFCCDLWDREFFAVPYPTVGLQTEANLAFEIWDPIRESDLLRQPIVLEAYALIKSLLMKLDVAYFSPMHLTEVFLGLIHRENENYWHQSIGCIVLDILDYIREIIRTGFLPRFLPTISVARNMLKLIPRGELRKYLRTLTTLQTQIHRLSKYNEIPVAVLRKSFYMPSYEFGYNTDPDDETV